MRRIITYCLIMLISASSLFAGTIDSLENIVAKQTGLKKAETYVLLSQAYKNSDLNKSTEYAFKSLKIAELFRSDKIITEALVALTIAYYSANDLINAEKYCKLSYEAYKKTQDTNQLASIYNNFGLIYLDLGKNDLSLEYLKKFLEIETITGTSDGIAMAYSNIGMAYEIKGEIDTALFYYTQSLEIDKKNNNIRGMAFSYNNLGIINEYLANYEAALENYELSIDYFEKCGDMRGLASVENNIGIIYSARGDYNKALGAYQKSLEIEEKMGNPIGTATALNNIGEIYSVWGELDQAMDYYKRSLELSENSGNLSDLAIKNLNIGTILDKKGLDDSALVYFETALQLYGQADNIEGKAGAFNNLGSIYFSKSDFKKAHEYFSEALKIRKHLKEKKGTAMALLRLAEVYVEWKQYDVAFSYLKQSREMLLEAKIYKDLVVFYKINAILNGKIGNYGVAIEELQNYSNLKDSIYNVETFKQFTDLRERFESEKIENELKRKNSENELIKAETILEKEKERQLFFFIIIISAGVFFVLVFFVIFFYLNRQKKRINRTIEEQNEELKQQKEEITSQRDEIEAQRDELQWQHNLEVEQRDMIANQHEEINDSIKYTRNIQEALRPDITKMKEFFSDVLIIHKPKEIISGDFSLFHENEENIVFAVADATGHGVPSAFISMLGLAIINDLLLDKTLDPAEILERCRKEFISVFAKENKDQSGHREGIDMGMVKISKNKNDLMFAGARRPLYVLDENGKLTFLEADRMPIGEHRMSDTSFSLKKLHVKSGSTVFLFTDGLTDQIGGPEKIKFGKKRLEDFIIRNGKLPLIEMEKLFNKEFEEWMGTYKQVDDIIFTVLRF